EALPEGCLLTCNSGAYGVGIAEHLLAMMLTLQKRLPVYWEQQKTGTWKNAGPVGGVEGSTIMVLGLGDIGGHFARRVKAMDAHVLGVRRTGEKPEWVDELIPLEQLDEALPRADVVALCLPGTPATDGMFNKERLAKMKPGAILLNVGRGAAIDCQALADSLEAGHLGGCGLDVTDPEPLPADHPLWKAPGAFITPHISGGYNFYNTRRRIVGIATDNLRRYVAGEELLNLVDPATGYRRLEGRV
ncbi:MAG: D-2-hydroxyacid dehydrogenase, partial [Clostridia bacterium]|nr:D-2-hydroxyacid dehydrogenase [Clostridia bacterium]